MAGTVVTDTVASDAAASKTPIGIDNMTSSNDQPNIVTATKSLGLETSFISEDETKSINDNPSAVADKETENTTVGGTPLIEHKLSRLATIEDLPNELLSQIFGFLDIPPPSANSAALLGEPKFDLTDVATTDLKASSQVSKRWREAILPKLFRHARFVIEQPEPKMPVRNLKKEIQPFLEFVNKNTLLKIITTFVLIVMDRSITGDEVVPEHKLDIHASFWRSLFKTIDPVELLIIAHPEVLGGFTSCHVYAADSWNFDCPCHYLRLRRPEVGPAQPAISEKAVPPNEYPTSSNAHEVVEPVTSNFSVENVPEDLLKHEPTPETIDDSLEAPSGPTDNIPEPSSSESRGTELFGVELEPWQIHHPQASTLFEIRPWLSLLLNEGSFIKAYSTYEFWLRRAPSVSFFYSPKAHIVNKLCRFCQIWLAQVINLPAPS